jgi:hypothetical protein
MRMFLPLIVAAALALPAAPDARAAAEKFEGDLPATLKGNLVIDEPAEAVEDGAEAIAIGTLTVGDKEYSVEVPEALAAKVPAGGGAASVTLAEESEEFGYPTYKVTAVVVE